MAAPAGFVTAGEERRPYIVVFRDEAVTREVTDSHVYFVRTPGARNQTHQTDVRPREVDGERVRAHVSQLQSRIRIRIDNVYDSALGGFAAELTSAQVRALEADPAVESVLPDKEIKLDEGRAGGGIRTTANPGGTVPAGIRRTGVPLNALALVDGQDTRVNADVAVLDTGIERDHPDLNVAGGYNCTSRYRDRWGDADGHGTHVAGTIGALDNRIGVVGVAPGARLWSVKVLGAKGSGRTSWLVCGIDWVSAQRDAADPSRPLFEVANMSISYSGRRSDRDCGRATRDRVHEAICRSVERGTVYVVAAGNESRNARLNNPASYDEVITVSALADYDGKGGGHGTESDSCPYSTPERDDAFTTFSNYGEDVDLIAPGRCVLSTYTRKRYAWMSGTSMATPHVAGAAAVYRAMFSRATPHQVKLALQAAGTDDWRTSTDPDRTAEKAVWIGEFGTMPDFSTSVTATPEEVTAGDTFSLSLQVTRAGGLTDPVSVQLSNPPTGFAARPVKTGEDSATIEIESAPTVGPGHYILVLRSISYDIHHANVIAITVRDETDGANYGRQSGPSS